MSSADALLSQVLALPPLEREQLVAQVVTSLEVPREKASPEWSRELERRVAEYERGEVEAIDIEDAMRIARQRPAEKRPS
jgi:putative addiction module component (TIGR02574 family)